jgi:CO/xanthine dehydrogenase Mo-binding subunit
MGIAAFLHGAGFTGSGERYLSSVVGVEGCADGSVRVLVSSTEFGQGTNTVLSQIAAEALGSAVRRREHRPAGYFASAQQRPNRGVAHGHGGGEAGAVRGAGPATNAHGVRSARAAYSWTNFARPAAATSPRMARFRSWAQYEAPPGIFWDDKKYRGEAYAAFAWAVYVAEVTVDLTTYSVAVNDFVALQEVGKVLHPVLARGQIHRWESRRRLDLALYEKVVWQNGRMQNGQMTNYIMPTSSDLPPIRVLFEELGNVHGAYGAKGIGELPMDGPAPAIVNAVEDALGIRFDSIPLLPEEIMNRLKGFGLLDGLAASSGSEAAASEAGSDERFRRHSRAKSEISFTVNGELRTVLAYPMERLLDVLRQQLGIDRRKGGMRRRRMRFVLGVDGRRARE